MKMRCLVFAALALCGLTASGNPSAGTYVELRSAAVRKCQVIDAGEYQTGLYFNPDGYRSYNIRIYVRIPQPSGWPVWLACADHGFSRL
jgi:hypothetical protein